VKRVFAFVQSVGSVAAELDGELVSLPVFPGILKHPLPEDLGRLLAHPAVARKYTIEALRIAAWPLLRQFPRSWLRRHLPEAHLRPERRRALEFLLG